MIDARDHPLLQLNRADLDMITAFVLASGSIKELARQHGVSYPTMRTRLNGLIERLDRRVSPPPVDPLVAYLSELIDDGRLGVRTARKLRSLHEESLRN